MILRIQCRHFFTKLTKYSKESNIPAVINESRSKTLIVVKPNSHLFKKPKVRERWKYSPLKFLDDAIREAFPLKTIYRADMSQGMGQLYEDINEQMDLQCFLSTFKLPDNMASWIRISELHVFLLCAKFRPEEYLGKAAIEYLMQEYFNDIEYRSRRFAPRTAIYKKQQLETIKLHTKYIFMGYDEGVQENDMVLAAAIWRRFFGYKCDDLALIERLVKYIRVQLTHLQTIKFRNLIFYRLQLFVPLSEIPLENSLVPVPRRSIQLEKRKLYSSTLPWINENTYKE